LATVSCRSEIDVDRFYQLLSIFKSFGKDPKSECFCMGDGLILGASVFHCARDLHDFRNPPSVHFLFNLYSELHISPRLFVFRLTFAITGVQKQSAAALLHVRVMALLCERIAHLYIY